MKGTGIFVGSNKYLEAWEIEKRYDTATVDLAEDARFE